MTSFSIVTIVYNDVTHIKETMESVINQSYKNIEYILVDGKSNDGTKEAILELITSCATITLEDQKEDRFYLEATHNTYPTLTFKLLSEKDKGIYDAMNKGIALATKEWINFMNCGDKFYNLNVLKQVIGENIRQYDIIYGDTYIYFKEQQIGFARKAKPLSKLYCLFSGFNHQSFFIKTALHHQKPYKIKYKLASDYDFIYDCFINKKQFGYIPHIIATFTSGGSSDKNAFRSLKEALRVALIYNSSISRKFKIYNYLVFAIIKKIIKIYFPNKVIKLLLYPIKRGLND